MLKPRLVSAAFFLRLILNAVWGIKSAQGVCDSNSQTILDIAHLKRVSNSDLTSVLFILLLLVGLAQFFGYLFVKIRQPRVVGEILAGIVLGPAILGRIPAVTTLLEAPRQQSNILNFVYWLGLLLLMFLSGAETGQFPRL